MEYKTEVTVEVGAYDFGQALRYSDDQAHMINGMADHIWNLSPFASDAQIIHIVRDLDGGGKELVRRIAYELLDDDEKERHNSPFPDP